MAQTPKEEVFDILANAVQGYFVSYAHRMSMYAFVNPRDITVVYKDRTFKVAITEEHKES